MYFFCLAWMNENIDNIKKRKKKKLYSVKDNLLRFKIIEDEDRLCVKKIFLDADAFFCTPILTPFLTQVNLIDHSTRSCVTKPIRLVFSWPNSSQVFWQYIYNHKRLHTLFFFFFFKKGKGERKGLIYLCCFDVGKWVSLIF